MAICRIAESVATLASCTLSATRTRIPGRSAHTATMGGIAMSAPIAAFTPGTPTSEIRPQRQARRCPGPPVQPRVRDMDPPVRMVDSRTVTAAIWFRSAVRPFLPINMRRKGLIPLGGLNVCQPVRRHRLGLPNGRRSTASAEAFAQTHQHLWNFRCRSAMKTRRVADGLD